MAPITKTAARNAAREFIRYITTPDREWDVGTAASFLPDGWELSDAAEQGDFFPVTIANVAETFRAYARPIS